MGSLYLLVVALASWTLGLKVLVPFVVVTTLVWTGMEWLLSPHSARGWLVAWNVCNRLLALTLIGGAIHRIKTTLEQRRLLINELRDTLLEFSRLKEILPSCRFCRRVHLEAEYAAKLNKLLGELSDAAAIGDLCPDCLEERRQQVAEVPVSSYFAERVS